MVSSARIMICSAIAIVCGCAESRPDSGVFYPSICQMVFSEGFGAEPGDLQRFLEFLEVNSEHLIHSPKLIEGSIYVKGDCYFLQRGIYINQYFNMRSRTEYNDWPFDPE